MKILLDPILTARPEQCSTTVQYWALVNYLLNDQKRTDLFFYWMVPKRLSQEELEFYPKHPNVQLIFVPQHKDRVKEYMTLSKEVDQVVAFNGSHWDWDVLITTRSGLAQVYRLLSGSPRAAADHRIKKIWVIEEMPLMSFKKTVPQFGERTQDLFTLAGYLAADKVFITLCHEKKGILNIAMQHFGASKVRELTKHIQEFVPCTLKNFETKPATRFYGNDGQPFGLCYVGRMDKTSSRLDEINELMIAGKAKYQDKIDPFVCTVSQVFKVFDQTAVDVKNYKRDDFWNAMRKRAHLGIMLHMDAGFTLSLAEPLCLGVPFLVTKQPWSVAMLGENYPFWANNKSECWAWIEAFMEDYDTYYQVFEAWLKGTYFPRMQGLFETHLLYPMLEQELDALDQAGEYAENHPAGTKMNAVMKPLLEIIKHQDEIVVGQELWKLVDLGTLTNMKAQLSEDARDEKGLVWATVWNDIRMYLKTHYGWEDASTITGHLRRPKQNPVLQLIANPLTNQTN